MKEQEFRKKVEEYKAAKEGFQSAFQGLAAVEPKVYHLKLHSILLFLSQERILTLHSTFLIQIPGKFLKSGHVFSAKRADQKVGTH